MSHSISIHDPRCKGCAFCVEFCPKDVYRMEDGRPVVEKPELCTGCALCVAICPEFAIKVERSQEHAVERERKA